MRLRSGNALSAPARELVEAIEAEHEPVYSDGSELFLENCVIALSRGQVLTALGRAGRRVTAYPSGRVFLGGEEVTVTLNPPEVTRRSAPPRGDFVYMGRDFDELAELMHHRRGKVWAPYLRLPGDAFDAAYAFYALAGWGLADRMSMLAQGCHECRNGVVELGSGVYTPCACQGPWCDDEDEVPAPVRPEDVEAREEEGAWYDGAALLRRGLLAVAVARAAHAGLDVLGDALTVGSGLHAIGVTQAEVDEAFRGAA